MTTADPRRILLDHVPDLRGFAMGLTCDPMTADDIVQDAVIKAWSHAQLFKPSPHLRAWLFRILRDTFYASSRNFVRAATPTNEMNSNAPVDHPAQADPSHMTGFYATFRQLPDEQREALLLVGASGFSYEEAAELCGVAIGTVRNRTARGRQRLAELMQLDDEDALEMTHDAPLFSLTAAQALQS